MDFCAGIIGIANKKPKEISDELNGIVWDYRSVISGRMGIPRHDQDTGIISLIVEGGAQEIKGLENALKEVEGLSVKALYFT
jgi:putative iron-only hydrogenase system regulator